ncbi:hypothetical protein J1P26_21940 [Neobacillus sp. MM2021_6]|uniref:hypothetical protein n=1 Tax=Bacillaceae TaxID=186817 RepID=UPI00140B1AF0|nr:MULTISPECIES: hypothetical protein [Bacillaceae]MBO0962369.1 hypothetical protein [Neobacillus sp. MM2021_6]NHC20852.1 hypothetical protein [Bacillus sp. MM2020_4]
MGILLEAVKHRKKVRQKAPLEVKREIVLDELRAMNVTTSRCGKAIESLDYEALKEEWVIASILWVDIENENGKWF